MLCEKHVSAQNRVLTRRTACPLALASASSLARACACRSMRRLSALSRGGACSSTHLARRRLVPPHRTATSNATPPSPPLSPAAPRAGSSRWKSLVAPLCRSHPAALESDTNRSWGGNLRGLGHNNYLGMILNARVYDVSVETPLQVCFFSHSHQFSPCFRLRFFPYMPPPFASARAVHLGCDREPRSH